MNKSDKVVWLIDGDEAEAKEYKDLLTQTETLDVRWARPQPALTDYDTLVSDARTGAVLVDYDLDTDAGVNYTGLDVADYLRALSSELPIFILTDSFDTVIEKGGRTVDSIITKERLIKHTDAYAARILRSMSRYTDALTERQIRIRELVDKQIAGKLTKREEKELAELRLDVERPSDALLSRYTAETSTGLTEQRAMLDQLQQITATLKNL